MPELFGTSYVLPAIIVVVLLAVLLAVLFVNRRRKAAAPVQELKRIEPAPSRTSDARLEQTAAFEQAVATERITPFEAAPALEDASEPEATPLVEGSPSVEPTPASAAVGHTSNDGPGEQSPGQAEPASSPRPLSQGPAGNPILPVILTMLEGWGDVSDEDLERLSVFRPEKVLETLETLQLPKDLQRNDDVRFRVEQMSLYAARLQSATDAADMTVQEFEEMPAPGAEAREPLAFSGGQEPGSADPTRLHAAAAAEGAAAVSGEAEAGAAEEVSAQDWRSKAAPAAAGAGLYGAAFYGSRDDKDADEQIDTQRTWRSPDTTSQARPADEAPPAIPESPIPPPSALPWTEESNESPASTRGGSPDEGASLAASTQAGRAPGDNFASEELRSTEGSESVQKPDLAAYAGAVAGAGSGTKSDLDDTIETVPKPQRALGAFVRTADDLLALPPDERMEMTTFLPPAELAAVLRRTQDPELKKAVIETLENIGKPSSLDVLRELMKDDDEEVRLRAQQAADRIMRL